jgi:glycosyltransferase involved in cell wall biosynthesis
MYKKLDASFCFIQTIKMEEERLKMGWQEEKLAYVKYAYEEPDECRQLILDSDVVLFGGCEEESYLVPRLKSGKPVIRYSERLYKTGQWKMVTPRGLKKKYIDHTRYRKKPVYLLCAGAYVPSDFSLIHAYPGKMYRWGYFPETRHYQEEALMEGKPKQELSILWAGRFLDWKHPEAAILCANYLRNKGYSFHLHMIGNGDQEQKVKELIEIHRLENRVSLLGYRTPKEVRTFMERANIFLATSDRQEGWGAVINEAMNSGCAVVANHCMGAVPYLIHHTLNGMIYQDDQMIDLFTQTETLIQNQVLRNNIGLNAYRTIIDSWNAEAAAERLLDLMNQLGILSVPTDLRGIDSQLVLPPCSPAPVVAERDMYQKIKEGEF